MNQLSEYLTSIDSFIKQEIPMNDGGRIVLISWSKKSNLNEIISPQLRNVMRVDNRDNIIWTVIPPHPLEGIYSGIKNKGAELIGNNLSGNVERIDWETGNTSFKFFAK